MAKGAGFSPLVPEVVGVETVDRGREVEPGRVTAGLEKGSRAQKREKVGTISRRQLREIATAKMRGPG